MRLILHLDMGLFSQHPLWFIDIALNISSFFMSSHSSVDIIYSVNVDLTGKLRNTLKLQCDLSTLNGNLQFFLIKYLMGLSYS